MCSIFHADQTFALVNVSYVTQMPISLHYLIDVRVLLNVSNQKHKVLSSDI